MLFSKRIAQLEPSATLALNTKAKELRDAGNDVVNFTVGEPDYSSPILAVEAACKALKEGKTRYGAVGGSLELRQIIARKLQKENNLEYYPDQIVCGIGAKELLFHTFLALLNDGDEVILSAPYWVSYADQIKAAGGVPIIIPFDLKAGGSLVNPSQIEKFASEKTKAFVLCSPNNPAGYVLSTNELQTLGSYLETKNWWVISDEIYEYMNFIGPHVSILNCTPGLKERSVIINGISKSFAMTGWRVGYCAGPFALMRMVRDLQGHSSTCLPPFIEEGAKAVIGEGKDLMKKEIESLKARRDLAVSMVKGVPNLTYVQPDGAFYLFADISECLKNSKYAPLDTMTFCTHLLENDFIATVPGEAFGCPGFIRFSYAVSESNIKKGMARFRSALSRA